MHAKDTFACDQPQTCSLCATEHCTLFLQDYFFDQSLLAEGELPNDRLCRVCSKIGHIAKECPRVLARKERYISE